MYNETTHNLELKINKFGTASFIPKYECDKCSIYKMSNYKRFGLNYGFEGVIIISGVPFTEDK
jgi:hypothetical protein